MRVVGLVLIMCPALASSASSCSGDACVKTDLRIALDDAGVESLHLLQHRPEGKSTAGNSYSTYCTHEELVASGKDCTPCLCSFDVDRTLTGRQGDLKACPNDEVLPVYDCAYEQGSLTLSPVGQSLANTFCAGCYVAIVTAGNATGYQSKERAVLADMLGKSGKLVSTEWTGPSLHGDHRSNCSGVKVQSTLVVGCVDKTKQYAVASIVDWLQTSHNVAIARKNVYHFDDREDNIAAFRGTGFNAIQVSCEPRDSAIGLCGAQKSEISAKDGVNLCYSHR